MGPCREKRTTMTTATKTNENLNAAEINESLAFALHLAEDSDVARRFRARRSDDDVAQDLAGFARLVAALAGKEEA